jgi:hypothetical protein
MANRGTVNFDQVITGDRLGNGIKFQMAAGSFTSGHVLVYDSTGTAVDGGSASSVGQTPWMQDIDAAAYNLNNLNSIAGSASSSLWMGQGMLLAADDPNGSITLDTNKKSRVIVNSTGMVEVLAPDSGGVSLTVDGSISSGVGGSGIAFSTPLNAAAITGAGDAVFNSVRSGRVAAGVGTVAGSPAGGITMNADWNVASGYWAYRINADAFRISSFSDSPGSVAFYVAAAGTPAAQVTAWKNFLQVDTATGNTQFQGTADFWTTVKVEGPLNATAGVTSSNYAATNTGSAICFSTPSNSATITGAGDAIFHSVTTPLVQSSTELDIYSGTNVVAKAPLGGIYLQTGSSLTTRLVVTSAGNVNIGAPDSGNTLTVSGNATISNISIPNSANPAISCATALAPIRIATYNAGGANAYGVGVMPSQLTFGAQIDPNSGTPQMVLTSGGLLGVGITTPAYTLDVNGDVNCSGAFHLGGHDSAGPLPTSGNASIYYDKALNHLMYSLGGSAWQIVGSGAAAGNQTPWLQNIDANTYSLNNLGSVIIPGAGAAHAVTVDNFRVFGTAGAYFDFQRTDANDAILRLYKSSGGGGSGMMFFVDSDPANSDYVSISGYTSPLGLLARRTGVPTNPATTLVIGSWDHPALTAVNFVFQQVTKASISSTGAITTAGPGVLTYDPTTQYYQLQIQQTSASNRAGLYLINSTGQGFEMSINPGTSGVCSIGSYGTPVTLFASGGAAVNVDINNVVLIPAAAGSVYVQTGASSANRVIVNSAGNVQINAPDSGTALTVAGLAGYGVSITGNGAFIGDATGAVHNTFQNSNNNFHVLSDGTIVGTAIAASNGTITGANFVATNPGGNLCFNTPSNAATITGAGDATFHSVNSPLVGTTGGGSMTTDAASVALTAVGAGGVNLKTNSLLRLYINSAGNVNINPPDSGYGLTAAGDTYLKGVLRVGDADQLQAGAAGANIAASSASPNPMILIKSKNDVYAKLQAIDAGPVYVGAQSAHPMCLITNNSSRLVVDATGSVQINQQDGYTYSVLNMAGAGGGYVQSLAGPLYLRTESAFAINLATGGSGLNRMVIGPAGQVTINAPDSGVALTVAGQISATSTISPVIACGTNAAPVKIATWSGSGAAYGIGVAASQLTFGAAIDPNVGVPQMVLTTSAQLGIGKTAPAYSVDVSGDVNVTGTFRVNGTPIGTTGSTAQTPWLQNINAAGFSLTGASSVTTSIGAGTSYGFTVNQSSNSYSDIAGVHFTIPGGTGTAGDAYIGLNNYDQIIVQTKGAYSPYLRLDPANGEADINGNFIALVTTNGKQRLTINSAGTVTINAPDSGNALNVVGTINTNTAMYANLVAGQSWGLIVNQPDGTSYAGLYLATSTATMQLYQTSGSSGVLSCPAGLSVASGTGAASRLVISAAGNVTINAPDSGVPLTVSGQASLFSSAVNPSLLLLSASGSTNNYINFADVSMGGAGFGYGFLRWTRDGNQGRRFDVFVSTGAGVTTLAIEADWTGFVGIGKTSPAYALDVNGDANVSGVFRINGVAIQASGGQTPWTQNIDAAGHNLSNVGTVTAGGATFVGYVNITNTANTASNLFVTPGGAGYYAGVRACNGPDWTNSAHLFLYTSGAVASLLCTTNGTPATLLTTLNIGGDSSSGLNQINFQFSGTTKSSIKSSGAFYTSLAGNATAFVDVSQPNFQISVTQSNTTNWAAAQFVSSSGQNLVVGIQPNNLSYVTSSAGLICGSSNACWYHTGTYIYSYLGNGNTYLCFDVSQGWLKLGSSAAPAGALDVTGGGYISSVFYVGFGGTSHLLINPNQAATGEFLAGVTLSGKAGNSVNFMPGDGSAGATNVFGYYDGAMLRSAMEIANTTGSTFGTLKLMRSGGQVNIGNAGAYLNANGTFNAVWYNATSTGASPAFGTNSGSAKITGAGDATFNSVTVAGGGINSTAAITSSNSVGVSNASYGYGFITTSPAGRHLGMTWQQAGLGDVWCDDTLQLISYNGGVTVWAGASVVNLSSGSNATTRLQVSAAGNVTISAPDSGGALSVSGNSVFGSTTTGSCINTTTQATTGSNYALLGQAIGSGATLNVALYANASGATTNYGLYIVAPPAGPGNWAIMQGATAPSYFAGSVGIGATPTCALTVSGQISATSATSPVIGCGTNLAPVKVATYLTGATAYGIGVNNNQLTFGAGIDPNTGTPQMVLSSNGYVGIGSAPTYPLVVSAGADRMLNFRGDAASFGYTAAGIILESVNSAQSGYTPMTFATSGLYLMGGSVGIGTQTPGYALDVVGTVHGSTGVYAGNPAGQVGSLYMATGGASPISNRLVFGTDNSGWRLAISKQNVSTVTDLLTVVDSGNVGIGTTSPAYKLDVAGDVNCTGAFRINGVPVTGSQTPWAQDIDAATHNLNNLGTLNFANTNTPIVLTNTSPITAQGSLKMQATGASATQTILKVLAGLQSDSFTGGYGAVQIFNQPDPANNSYLNLDARGSAVELLATQVGAPALTITNMAIGSAPSVTTLAAINFQFAGTIKAVITSAGNVGIGITAPLQPLHVLSSTADSILAIDVPNQTSYNPILAFRVQAQTVWNIGVDTGDAFKLKISNGGNWDNIRAGTLAVTITSAGLVGIGTALPGGSPPSVSMTTGLVVKSAGGTAFVVQGSGGNSLALNPAPGGSWTMYDYGAGSWTASITSSSGMVGIGTATPGSALDVIGNIHLTGALNTVAKGNLLGTASGGMTAPAVTDANIQLYNFSSVNWSGIGTDGSGNMWLKVGTAGTPAPAVVLQASNGFVGIGTITPGDALDVVGTGRFSGEVVGLMTSGGFGQFRMFSSSISSFWRNDGSSTYLLLTASGDPYGSWNSLRPITFNNGNGYVAINGAATTYPLNVAGDVNITGAYRVNGTPLAAGGAPKNPQQVFNGSGTFTPSAALLAAGGWVTVLLVGGGGGGANSGGGGGGGAVMLRTVQVTAAVAVTVGGGGGAQAGGGTSSFGGLLSAAGGAGSAGASGGASGGPLGSGGGYSYFGYGGGGGAGGAGEMGVMFYMSASSSFYQGGNGGPGLYGYGGGGGGGSIPGSQGGGPGSGSNGGAPGNGGGGIPAPAAANSGGGGGGSYQYQGGVGGSGICIVTWFE